MEKEKIIWHYTSMESFIQIIKSKRLRFSKATCLNDKNELNWVKYLCEEVVRNDCDNISKIQLKLFTEISEILEISETIAPYIASFSKVGDELTQWISYADNGKGVAIGFYKDWLQEIFNTYYITNNQNIFFQNIKYIENTICPYKLYQTFMDIYNNIKKEIILSGSLDANIFLTSYFIKNPAFKNENEFRFCYLPDLNHPNVTPTFTKKDYRVSNNKLIPFFDLSIDTGIKLPIAEIILGPNNINSDQIIKQVLWEHTNSDPKIRKSIIPYS